MEALAHPVAVCTSPIQCWLWSHPSMNYVPLGFGIALVIDCVLSLIFRKK